MAISPWRFHFECSEELSKKKEESRYWDAEKKFVDATKINFEKHLSFLPDFDLITLKTLDSEDFNPCDLLLVTAFLIDANDFSQWLDGLNKRIVRQNSIWTPALIFTDLPFAELSASIHDYAADNNWYFDIVSADHLDSMPIRIANLLRIHDHLHELFRYQERLDQMQTKVSDIEEKLDSCRETPSR